MSDNAQEIVIVHVSDTQFGQYHRFTEGHDSLASRMLQDLKAIQPEIGAVDLLIASGDVVEQGKRSEFDTARAFFEQMASALDLDMNRIVVVPGNHDVSWAACRSYFADCEAREIEPTVPYEPKYEFFIDFIESLEGSRPSSTYGVRHFPSVDLSVAYLDSTRKESHEQHFGYCGEDQLREIAEELDSHGLGRRIAVLHHNVRRKAEADNENLVDEDNLSSILGPHVDLVLHGHTHDGKRDYLSGRQLVLSTGSAAITPDWRPIDAGNQYQILKLSTTTIARRARQYVTNRWVADGRVGTEESPGYEVIELPNKFGAKTPTKESAPAEREVSPPSASVDVLARVATHQEIDHDLFREFREALRADAIPSGGRGLQPMEVLARLGLAREGRLTVAAAMLVGAHPQSELPQAEVKCVRYFGLDKTADRDSEVIQGAVWRQVDDAYNFLLSRMDRRESTSGIKVRSEVAYRYPTKCLREVVVNALVHRDYSDEERSTHIRLFNDRIEVWSPGSWLVRDLPLTDTSIVSLSGESVRRNPVLARALASIRYFEGEGSGLPVALQDSTAAGAPEPTARSDGGFVVVTVRPSEYDPDVVARAGSLAKAQSEFATRSTSPAGDGGTAPKTPRLKGVGDEGATRLSLQQFANLHDRGSVIVGPAGAGKTTTLRSLPSLVDYSSELPIFIRGSTSDVGPSVSDLPSVIGNLWSGSGVTATRPQVDAILKEHPCWVMIDDFELFDEWCDDVLAMLHASLASYPMLRVTIATRPTGYQFALTGYREWSRYEMLPLTQPQFEKLIIDRGHELDLRPDFDAGLANVRQALKATPQLRQLIRVPLIANFVADAAYRYSPLSSRYCDVVDQALYLIESSDAHRGVKQVGFLSPVGERRILELLALEVLVSNRNWRDMPESWLVNEVARFLLDEDEARSTVRSIASRGALLACARNPESAGRKYGFTAKWIYENLAASGAVGRWASEPDTLAEVLATHGLRAGGSIAELALVKVERANPSLVARLVDALLARRVGLMPTRDDDKLLAVIMRAASQMSGQVAVSLAAKSMASIDAERTDEAAHALRERADELMHNLP